MHLQFHVYSLKQTWICDSSMPGKKILSQWMVKNGDESHGIEFAKNHLKQIQDYRIFPLADTYHLHWECLSYKIVVTCGIWRTSNVQEKNQKKTDKQPNKTKPNKPKQLPNESKQHKQRNKETKNKKNKDTLILQFVPLWPLPDHVGRPYRLQMRLPPPSTQESPRSVDQGVGSKLTFF